MEAPHAVPSEELKSLLIIPGGTYLDDLCGVLHIIERYTANHGMEIRPRGNVEKFRVELMPARIQWQRLQGKVQHTSEA